jgi:hypothetical protein
MSMSAAMSGEIDRALSQHLLRRDGQEDVCLATYAISTGATRTTALIDDYLLPGPGERAIHGNASFTGDYIVGAAVQAAAAGRGVVALHSHPSARGWQMMSAPDHDTERSYAHLVSEITGMPLVGMTLAGGDGQWSCRRWSADGAATHGESVRVIDDHVRISWNDRLRPAPELPQPAAHHLSVGRARTSQSRQDPCPRSRRQQRRPRRRPPTRCHRDHPGRRHGLRRG